MFKKIAKAGALFFAVGVALALIAPPLASALGAGVIGEAALATAIATPVIWTGAFFGAFGAINTAMEPVFNKLFGDDKKMAEAQDCAPKVVKHMHITVVKEAETDKHRELIAAQRQETGAGRTPG